MFHVMLVLPVLIVLAILASVVLFGVVAIVAAVVGGTTVALLVKDRTVKKLLFTGFFTILFMGLLCLAPVAAVYLGLSMGALALTAAVICVCIMALSVFGIRTALTIGNQIGKTVLIVLFCLILIAAASLTVFTALGSYFFT